MSNVKLTDEWVEDYGYCIFFHFENFEEPPEICCDAPTTIGFDAEYWTHFTAFDFNEVMKQAEKINDDGAQEFTAN